MDDSIDTSKAKLTFYPPCYYTPVQGVAVRQPDIPANQIKFVPPPVKKKIILQKSVLYPPLCFNSNCQEKPLGCKTIFVHGLPERTTAEVIEEIFQRCGVIESIRLKRKIDNKKFCLIRYSDELAVDSAMFFSDYSLKIENKDDVGYCGKIFVDYSVDPRDQFDYECEQRAIERAQRAVEPRVQKYTEFTASRISEDLRRKRTFSQAAHVLVRWLERGECTKKTSGNFYSMIQCAFNHINKLQVCNLRYKAELQGAEVKYKDKLNDAKCRYDEKIYRAKENYEKDINIIKVQFERLTKDTKVMVKEQCDILSLEFNEIGKIFKAAYLKKCWDNFTKGQRKSIETCEKQIQDLRNAHVKVLLNERKEDEMELSDSENEDSDMGKNVQEMSKKNNKLGEKKNLLKTECDAVKGEISVMKLVRREELKLNNVQLAEVRQTLTNLKTDLIQQQMLNNNGQTKELETLKNQYEIDIISLREENESLRSQLKDQQKRIDSMQLNFEELLKQKDIELAAVQQASQNSNEELSLLTQQLIKNEAELRDLRSFAHKTQSDDTNIHHNSIYLASTSSSSSQSLGVDQLNEILSSFRTGDHQNGHSQSASCSPNQNLERDHLVKDILASLQNIHNSGANIDLIISFLQQTYPSVRIRDVSDVVKLINMS